MSSLVAIVIILLICGGAGSAQTVSVEVSASYLPSFTQRYALVSPLTEFEGFNLVGGTVLCNLDKPFPLSTGIGVSLGRKLLLDYHLASSQPEGAGPTDMSRRIQLLMVEVPVLYRFNVVSFISIRGGVLVGHATLKRFDHILATDFESTINKVIVSPEADVGIDLPCSFRLGVGVEYRPLEMVFDRSKNYETQYALDGLWYRGSVGFSF